MAPSESAIIARRPAPAGAPGRPGAPNAGGFFAGDCEAMGTIGSTFLPFFVQTNCADSSCTPNRTDVYTGSF